jgi:hypothetical protein
MLYQQKYGWKTRVDFVFDDQGEIGKSSRYWYPLFCQMAAPLKDYLPPEPLFLDDEYYFPLQAADLYAWNVRRHLFDNKVLHTSPGYELPLLDNMQKIDKVIDLRELAEIRSAVEAAQRVTFKPKAIRFPNFPDLLKPTSEQPITLPSGYEVNVCKATPVFYQWRGAPPDDDYGGKRVLEFNREMLFAELVILRIFQRDAWEGRWIDTYRNKYRTGYWAKGDSNALPASRQVILDAIRAKAGRGGGCFDVFCWRGAETVFVESKWKGHDEINKNQKRWLEAALTLGIPLESSLSVEWTLA